MKLLLSGGGDSNNITHIDEFFASQIDMQKSVLYIPVAWEDDPTYTECFYWFSNTYHSYGIKNIEMCINLKYASNLSQYSAIYIGGGNTFKLLKEIKESRFDIKLIEYLSNSGFVYGGSAGSIIFGKDIIHAAINDENTVGLVDSSGINLVKGYNICCHYDETDGTNISYIQSKIKDHSKPTDITIALPENCAIYVENDTITFLGSGAVLFVI
ncbi:MAG: Type 1 glutamine amidotransferase-like domain-containing protein [Oscillospiraceae bacterium]|nr:Type 1 glutamine amidotransferase-like domain-containing protein [Oscillospiraceae bacterium]